jgi:hypothetical protein
MFAALWVAGCAGSRAGGDPPVYREGENTSLERLDEEREWAEEDVER